MALKEFNEDDGILVSRRRGVKEVKMWDMGFYMHPAQNTFFEEETEWVGLTKASAESTVEDNDQTGEGVSEWEMNEDAREVGAYTVTRYRHGTSWELL